MVPIMMKDQRHAQVLQNPSGCHSSVPDGPSTNTMILSRRAKQRLMTSFGTMPILLLLFSFIILFTQSWAQAQRFPQQQFRRTPDNQTATIGDRVTLACSIINKVGILQWTRDGFGLGVERNLQGYERYRMVGSEEEGKVSCDRN